MVGSNGAHLLIAEALETMTTTRTDANWQTDRQTGLGGHKQTSHHSLNKTAASGAAEIMLPLIVDSRRSVFLLPTTYNSRRP